MMNDDKNMEDVAKPRLKIRAMSNQTSLTLRAIAL